MRLSSGPKKRLHRLLDTVSVYNSINSTCNRQPYKIAAHYQKNKIDFKTFALNIHRMNLSILNLNEFFWTAPIWAMGHRWTIAGQIWAPWPLMGPLGMSWVVEVGFGEKYLFKRHDFEEKDIFEKHDFEEENFFEKTRFQRKKLILKSTISKKKLFQKSIVLNEKIFVKAWFWNKLFSSCQILN